MAFSFWEFQQKENQIGESDLWPASFARRNLPPKLKDKDMFLFFVNALFTQNHVYPKNHWTLQENDGFCYCLHSRILRLGDNFSLLWPWIPPNPSLWWRRETPASWEGKPFWRKQPLLHPKISQNPPWFRPDVQLPRWFSRSRHHPFGEHFLPNPCLGDLDFWSCPFLCLMGLSSSWCLSWCPDL